MNTLFLKLIVTLQNLRDREDGQDLIEYALLAAVIATASIGSARRIATAVSTVFSNVSTTLGA